MNPLDVPPERLQECQSQKQKKKKTQKVPPQSSRRIRFSPRTFSTIAVIVALSLASHIGRTTGSALPALSTSVKGRKETPLFETALVSSTATVSSSSPSTVASAASEEASGPDEAVVEEEGSSNAVVAVVVYLKNSVQRTIVGFGQLWSNHGRCKEIRSKIKQHQNQVRMQWEQEGLYDAAAEDDDKSVKRELDAKLRKTTGGISYEEFVFLQKGKEDRSKVMTLGFIMFGAPKFLPYMLMFNQQMLPSPLQAAPNSAGSNNKATGHGETLVETKSRERSATILTMLVNLEKEARSVPGLGKLNIFAGKQHKARMQQIASLNEKGMEFLQTTGVKPSFSASMPPTTMESSTADGSSATTGLDVTGGSGNYGARRLLSTLEPYLYKAGTDFDRASQRLVGLPQSVIRGLGNAAMGSSAGFLDNFLPVFMARSKLLDHVTKVETADDFMVHNKIDLTTISPRLLRDACSDRLIGGPGYSTRELRLALQEWLTLAVQVPEQRLKGGNAGSNKLYYNGNLARTALMGYYGLQAVQDSRCASALPRLVFTGHGSGVTDENIMNAPSASAGKGWRSRR